MPKIDEDVKKMSQSQLRQELMVYRRIARKMIESTNNSCCWINDEQLAALLPEQPKTSPITLTDEQFLRNCRTYLLRQRKLERKKGSR